MTLLTPAIKKPHFLSKKSAVILPEIFQKIYIF
jgi:hypothetical protein